MSIHKHDNQDILNQILSVPPTTSDHDLLNNLQGGDPLASIPEYYHLSLLEYNTILDLVDGNFSHNNLDLLQGGTTNEYYHLTSAQHSNLLPSATNTYTLRGNGSNWIASSNLINSGNTITAIAGSAASISLIVKGASSQSANLLEWQNSIGSVLSSVDKDGLFQGIATRNNVLNGFENRTDSTLGMSGSNFQVTTGSSYVFYSAGTKYTKTTTQQVAITNDNALSYVYFDTTGTLQVSSPSPWDITSDNVPVAMVYKSGSNYAIFDERHNSTRDRNWHEWAHETIGCRYESGGTTTFTNTTFSTEQFEVHDEDIEIDSGGTLTSCRLWYRNVGAASMTFESGISTPYKANLTNGIQYDNGGSLANVTANSYTNTWVYATNDKDYPVAIIVGQSQSASLTTIRATALPTIPGAPNVEWKLLYRTIYRSNGAAAAPTYVEAADYRTVSSGPAGVAVSNDHAALVNRANPNQHPATAISYDNTGSTLVADEVNSAIDELDLKIETLNLYHNNLLSLQGGDPLASIPEYYHLSLIEYQDVMDLAAGTFASDNIAYDNSTSDLTSSNVRDAIDELDDRDTVTLTYQAGNGIDAIVAAEQAVVYTRIPFDGTITKVTVLADISGSCVLDIWKDVYANFPPTVADTITASAKPTLSAAQKSEDATLTGWTKTITAGNCLAVKLDSASTVKAITMILEIKRT